MALFLHGQQTVNLRVKKWQIFESKNFREPGLPKKSAEDDVIGKNESNCIDGKKVRSKRLSMKPLNGHSGFLPMFSAYFPFETVGKHPKLGFSSITRRKSLRRLQEQLLRFAAVLNQREVFV